MGERRETYLGAANEHTTEEERLGLWAVFGYYRTDERGEDAIKVADRKVPSNYKPEAPDKDPADRWDYPDPPDGGRHPFEFRRRNVANQYRPLIDHPDLFDEFARLADEGEITREVWSRWINRYGVLGIQLGGSGRRQRNDTTDRFSTFVQEARLANRTLKLLEELMREDGPREEIVQELLPREYFEEFRGRGTHEEPVLRMPRKHVEGNGDRRHLEEAIRQTIAHTVQQKIDGDCFQRIVLRGSQEWREKKMSPFARGWEFNSLLGAMWLEFLWIVTAHGPRYCKNCGTLIPAERYKSAKTCSERCKKALQRSGAG